MASGMNGLVQEAQCESLMPRQVTVRENLENKRDKLRTSLADVDAALDALDANPEVSKVLELLARAGARL